MGGPGTPAARIDDELNAVGKGQKLGVWLIPSGETPANPGEENDDEKYL